MASGGEAQGVVLGRISGLFGVRGWVKLFSYTDPREGIVDYPDWLLARDGVERLIRVKRGQRHGKTVVAELEGIEDRDAAAELIGFEIRVARSALPDAGASSYYWADLEGLEVVRSNGERLGTVAYLMETGAHDVMVVAGEIERLIPFAIGQTVTSVDLAAGRIVVDWEWD